MKRCRWCDLDNPLYREYYNKEWEAHKIVIFRGGIIDEKRE